MSVRAEKVRKRSEEITQDNKKLRKSSSTTMPRANSHSVSESTATSHEEIDNLHLTEEANKIMENLQITRIDKIIADSMANQMAKQMEAWQGKITDTFLTRCSKLVETATEKTSEKMVKIEEEHEKHEDRIVALENMADDFEQSKRACNIVVRGLMQTEDTKAVVVNMLKEGLGLNANENDIRYAIKIAVKHETPGTNTVKVAFYDARLREDVYSRRLKLKGTNVFISEDLTLKKSALAYQAREYARSSPNATTWTSDGQIFLKDSIDGKPRIVKKANDLRPADPAPPRKNLLTIS